MPAEAAAGRRTVLFVDAAHFVYGAYLGYLWRLTRFFVPTGNGRRRYSVLGALDAATHRLHAVTTTKSVNTEVVFELFDKLRREIGGPITLVLDNAKYQCCEAVFQAAKARGIELLYLPTYSPNLNLIERLWKFVKGRFLASRVHKDFADLRRHIDDGIDDGIDEINQGTCDDELSSLPTHNFHLFEEVPIIAA
ncbi:MAG: IS630 family transposase [Planctomycetia bacterium]